MGVDVPDAAAPARSAPRADGRAAAPTGATPPGTDSPPRDAAAGSGAGPDASAAPGRAGADGGSHRAGLILAWCGVGPALAIVGFLVAAYPLALAGAASPLPVLLLAVPAITVLLGAVRRLAAVPATPTWAAVSTLCVAAAFAALSAATHAEHIVVRRDAGVYALTAHWIAEHGSLRIPAELAAVGGAGDTVSAGSPGFYPMGEMLAPQFMTGTALSLSPGGWVSDWGGIFVLPALYAALALLAVAGLAARLIGPRWAPVAALALGLTQPVLLNARTTYSEPLTQLLLFGGICLLLDALAAGPPGRRGSRPAAVLAGLAGLAIGLTVLLRVDAVRELALFIPLIGWLAARRRPQWLPFAAGLLVGAGYGLVDALGPSQRYASDLFRLIRPLLLAGAALAVVTTATVLLVRWLGPRVPAGWLAAARRWVPAAGALGVAAVFGYLTIRPVFGVAGDPYSYRGMVEGLQRAQGLPLDGTRSYAEQSVRWLGWYLGWPAVLLAGVGGVAITWWALRTNRERWLVALAVPLASTALVLWRPGITPDHPWADRRLVATVLPTVVLLAASALAFGVRRLAARPRWARAALAGGLVALVGPAAWASAPVIGARTEVGQPRAVDRACAAFPAGAVALLIDPRSRQEWVPALRQVCGVPTFAVPGEHSERLASRAEVTALAERVRSAGGRPVLVAFSGSPLPELTAAPQRQAVLLDTSEHVRLLTKRPAGLTGLRVELWLAEAD